MSSRHDDRSHRARDGGSGSSKRRHDDEREDRGRSGHSGRDGERHRDKKPRETDDERAQRKLAKKAERKLDRADAALLLPEDARRSAAEVSFYSQEDNPFHDVNLGDKFVWGKKREKERKQGMTPDEARRRDLERQVESQVRHRSRRAGFAGAPY